MTSEIRVEDLLWSTSTKLDMKKSEELLQVFSFYENIEHTVEVIHTYLLQHWRKFDFNEKCFFKKENKIHQNFRSLSTPKNKLFPREIKEIATETMWKDILKEPLDILNIYTDTDFVISGIQHMFQHPQIEDRKSLLHQPVIRVNGDGKGGFFISGEEGIWTSFVNTTKYKVNANIPDIVEDLENCLDFLSKISMHVQDISLRMKTKEDTWKWEKVFIFVIHIFYGNLNIGDTALIQKSNSPKIIKDLWFGLERVWLARNKFTNYFEQYLENKELLNRFSDVEIDTIKTLCLMHTTKNKELLRNAGPQSTYMKLLKKLSKTKNYFPILQIFFSYRGDFITTSENKTEKILTDIELHSPENNN